MSILNPDQPENKYTIINVIISILQNYSQKKPKQRYLQGALDIFPASLCSLTQNTDLHFI